MFQQFENDFSKILTSGVKNVADAAEEMMNTAGVIKSQQDKIRTLEEDKVSLTNQIKTLENKLSTSKSIIKKYREKLLQYEEGDATFEVFDKEKDRLLVLDKSIVENDSVEGELEAETFEEVSLKEDKNENDIDNHNQEMEIMWNKMKEEIETAAKLREELKEIKQSYRDKSLELKTENTNLTIALEEYRLETNELEQEIKNLETDNQELKYEIKQITCSKFLWRRSFYTLLMSVFFYTYYDSYINV